MAVEFLMPKLGLTMESGTIVEWLVADGDPVTAGSPVLVIETDKTETEVEATADGRLHRAGSVGDTFDCGVVIGWILGEGESAPDLTPPAAGVATAAESSVGPGRAAAPSLTHRSGDRLFASPNARRIAAERGIDLRTVHGTGPNGRIVSEDLDQATPSPVPATVAARQLAGRLGVPLTEVAADPTEGRVTREAVEAHVRREISASRTTAETTARPNGSYPLLQTPSEVIPFTGVRRTIAERMVASQSEMAQLTLHMDADVDAVVADRDARRDAGATVPSYTDYVIAATARALLDHPMVNAQVTGDGIALLPEVHVGMAVAIDGGLVVPVVSDAPGRDLDSLAAETARLAAAARTRALQLAELEGGTFSVTSLGMYGVDGFTPIVNPPNVAILGVGRIRDDLYPTGDGAVTTTKRVTLSLTWDHRVLDGAPAAAFCRSIVDLLARPDDLDRPAR